MAAPNSFEILEHPADMGLRITAEDLSQLFAQSALALTSVLVDPASVKPTQEQEIVLANSDREGLLYDWLSEILYFFDGEKMLFCHFNCEVESAEGGKVRLRAKVSGERYKEESHQVKTYVKAITFHQLKIEQTGGCCVATVYLDI